MKRRIKELEKTIGQEASIYVLEEKEDGSFKYFSNDKEGSFTKKEVEDLKAKENSLVLIVSWVGKKSEA